MTPQKLSKLIGQQREYYATSSTRPLQARQKALSLLEESIRLHQQEICNALVNDLGKCPQEAYMSEIGMVLEEIRYLRRHLAAYLRPRRVATALYQFPSRGVLLPEPYGNVLVMSPWNYPFLLAMGPFAGALAAGNTALLSPSPQSPSTSHLLFQLVEGILPPQWAAVVENAPLEEGGLLDQAFDYLFFTGSPKTGRLVMEKAAHHLTPVTLELGGKSPCVVDETANLPLAARRIVFGKYLNAGQTCVAPDYVLVQEKVKNHLLGYLKKSITECYGTDPLKNPQYGRIVNQAHFDRLTRLLPAPSSQARIAAGGGLDREHLRIEPTILCDVKADDPVMCEEIFGPILPILTYRTRQEAIEFITARPKPLAFYLFTQNKSAQREFFDRCSFGGGCVNDTIMHLSSTALPFGGVGESGMGRYHGKATLDTFTHWRSVLKSSTRVDPPMRYAPYTEAKEKLCRMFLGGK